MRIGMGCKAQTAAIAVAMARICNAADRPSPRPHTRAEIVNTFSGFGDRKFQQCGGDFSIGVPGLQPGLDHLGGRWRRAGK